MVSVHSVQLNINWSIITANWKTLSGNNSINMKYKIDMGSNGNTIPAYHFRKIFPDVTNEELTGTVNKDILLKHTIKPQLHSLEHVK